MRTTYPDAGAETSSSSSHASPLRAAGLTGRAHGDEGASGAPFVLLHGLTFDSRMWGPVHEAVLDAGLDAPIVVGHSIGGSLATNYAAKHPAVAVVSVDAPVRLEPFAQLLRSLRRQLAGDGFAEAWAIYQDSWHMELLPGEDRALLRAGDRPGDDTLRQLVLSYQSDLLERPLEEAVRARDERLSRLRAAGSSYLTLHPCSVDASDRAWLHERLPQAEILVWPVGHHFPHLAHPIRFAALLTGLAAGRAPTTPCMPR
jgi:pimeloyl-ACP methyl ester carboxylesterase